MIKTNYYYLDVMFPDINDVDLDMMASRVDYFNNRENFIFFDSLSNTTDSNHSDMPKAGKIRFIYISKTHSVRSEHHRETDEIEELTDLFEAPVELWPIQASKMTPDQLRSLKIANKVMYEDGHHSCDLRTRWVTKTMSQVKQDAEALIGYDDFKDFFKKLCVYTENVRKTGGKGNYNIVLINNCDADENLFIDLIYELYVCTGIAVDTSFCVGDLDDAMKIPRDTPFVFEIYENWEIGKMTNMFSATTQDVAFRELSKKKTIYITSIDKAQYEKALLIDSFASLFVHAVEIKELSEAEKLEYIRQSATSLGFTIDQKSLENSTLLKMSLSAIKARVSAAAQKKLIQTDTHDFSLSSSDFLNIKVCTGKSNYFAELDSMIGLKEVKDRVHEIVTFLNRRGKDALPCLHMVFRGNPGTGKTTVARLIGKIFAEAGILNRSDVFVETDREGLVGVYVGQTAHKTADKIKDAMGGVLFIDEAYSLGIYKDGVDYGQESISTLVKRMEDYRKDFVCIMAGYTDEMNKMLDINPGLRDRVQFYIDFPDYSADELLQIFCRQSNQEKYSITAAGKVVALSYFETIVRSKDEHFANARLARKIFERVRIKQSLRADSNVISKSDIDSVFVEKDMAGLLGGNKGVRRMGFGG